MSRAKNVYESPWLHCRGIDMPYFTDRKDYDLALCESDVAEFFEIGDTDRVQIALYDQPVGDCVEIRQTEDERELYIGEDECDPTELEPGAYEILSNIFNNGGYKFLYACCFIPTD